MWIVWKDRKLGEITTMTNLQGSFDWAWNHLGDALLDMSGSMFPERSTSNVLQIKQKGKGEQASYAPAFKAFCFLIMDTM